MTATNAGASIFAEPLHRLRLVTSRHDIECPCGVDSPAPIEYILFPLAVSFGQGAYDEYPVTPLPGAEEQTSDFFYLCLP